MKYIQTFAFVQYDDAAGAARICARAHARGLAVTRAPHDLSPSMGGQTVRVSGPQKRVDQFMRALGYRRVPLKPTMETLAKGRTS